MLFVVDGKKSCLFFFKKNYKICVVFFKKMSSYDANDDVFITETNTTLKTLSLSLKHGTIYNGSEPKKIEIVEGNPNWHEYDPCTAMQSPIPKREMDDETRMAIRHVVDVITPYMRKFHKKPIEDKDLTTMCKLVTPEMEKLGEAEAFENVRYKGLMFSAHAFSMPFVLKAKLYVVFASDHLWDFLIFFPPLLSSSSSSSSSLAVSRLHEDTL